jgi:polar amino acid transport system substrate-binding protein
MFVDDGLDALAGLRPALLGDRGRWPGSRVLDGKFSSVQQAMGTPRGRAAAGIEYLRAFVEEMKDTGFVADRIAAHGVIGLSVAPPAAQ